MILKIIVNKYSPIICKCHLQNNQSFNINISKCDNDTLDETSIVILLNYNIDWSINFK